MLLGVDTGAPTSTAYNDRAEARYANVLESRRKTVARLSLSRRWRSRRGLGRMKGLSLQRSREDVPIPSALQRRPRPVVPPGTATAMLSATRAEFRAVRENTDWNAPIGSVVHIERLIDRSRKMIAVWAILVRRLHFETEPLSEDHWMCRP